MEVVMSFVRGIKVMLLCTFVLVSSLYSQNLSKKELLEFYPYNIDNSWSYVWVYHDVLNDYYEAGREKIFISKDTVVDNIKYWVIQYDIHGYGNYTKYLERIDSVTGNVLRISDLSSGNIDCIDNVYANVGDTISISNNRDIPYCTNMVINSIRDTVINNFQTTIREVTGLPQLNKLFFARKIGLLGSGSNYWIDSAKVNGMAYNHITDIHEKTNPIVTHFNLQQNYPNPFNPSTLIKYSVVNSANVSLKIYDVLGNEVATLINEEKLSGSYEVVFDTKEGSQNLASGVYFYQLRAGDFVQTKKMILLR